LHSLDQAFAFALTSCLQLMGAQGECVSQALNDSDRPILLKKSLCDFCSQKSVAYVEI
jgi:hypothetical protein